MARMNFVILGEEISTDPLGRGYAGMTDKQVANDLNTEYRTQELDTLSGGVVYDAVDIPEFQALTETERAEVWNITHLGAEILVGPGAKARDRFITLFGPTSDTITRLQTLITVFISRAHELGLPFVREGDVTKVRS